MKRLYPLLIALLLSGFCKAQYVNIPDPTLANWLQSYYPYCMNGTMLDTTCTAILSERNVFVQLDSDMTGLEYFKGALYLSMANSAINQGAPVVNLTGNYPPNLQQIDFSYNDVKHIPENIPASVVRLDFEYSGILGMVNLPPNLTYLDCSTEYSFTDFGLYSFILPSALPSTLDTLIDEQNNNSGYIYPQLPPNLQYFSCNGCQIDVLPDLPSTLQHLDLDGLFHTTNWPLAWPSGLTYLDCGDDSLSTIPPLPVGLTTFYCGGNQLTALPALPAGITILSVWNNLYKSYPAWPAGLTYLSCYSDSVKKLPAFPATLQILECGGALDSLPAFPPNLTRLQCDHARIKSVPPFPAVLNDLTIHDCPLITSLPTLPPFTYMYNLDLDGDSGLACLPALPPNLQYFRFNGTALSCLPNYPSVYNNASPALNNFPLCDINSGCQANWNISGSVYYDANNDCNHQSNEPLLYPVKVSLYNDSTLVQQSIFAGGYSFKTAYGNYTVSIDTTGFPYIVSCGASDSTVSIGFSDSMQTVNFETQCKNGFNLGVNSIVSNDIFFPGDITNLQVIAGDYTKNKYGVSCNANGVGGQVQITITGPVTYTGVTNGTPSPTTVSGNILTWNVADFSQSAGVYNFNVLTSTQGNASEYVCVDVNVTTGTPGDNDLSDNNVQQCYRVRNSFDPNYKEVSPPGALVYPYTDWLTYTVHFQNTGTAPAQNIHITDTLDANVDPSTLQLLAYSYQPTVTINGRYVNFVFGKINLPDSTTNPEGSKGYVQYRVKPMANLPIGATINNQAYIYFDFNAPVVTNNTGSIVTVATGVKNEEPANNISVYPNPTTSIVNVVLSRPCVNCNLAITDITGREVVRQTLNGERTVIDISALPAAVYFIRISTASETQTVKLVKE